MTNKTKIRAIHNRIAKLAVAAIERGDIVSCDRVPQTETYLIRRLPIENPTTYTAVGAGTFLYLLNSLAREQ
jgi:DeoR/GlpR family transcriptional regulator of sugar metabolism